MFHVHVKYTVNNTASLICMLINLVFIMVPARLNLPVFCHLKWNFFLVIKSLRVDVQAKKDTINNKKADIQQEEETDNQWLLTGLVLRCLVDNLIHKPTKIKPLPQAYGLIFSGEWAIFVPSKISTVPKNLLDKQVFGQCWYFDILTK